MTGEPFLTKRDVLRNLPSDRQDLDPDQMTFLDSIKLTHDHLNNEEDDEMEEVSTTTQTYNPNQVHVSKNSSAILLLFPLDRTPELN